VIKNLLVLAVAVTVFNPIAALAQADPQPAPKPSFKDLFKIKKQITFSPDGKNIHQYVTYQSTLTDVLADNPDPYQTADRKDGGKDVTYRDWANAADSAGGGHPAFGTTRIMDFVFNFDSKGVLTNFAMLDKSLDPVAQQERQVMLQKKLAEEQAAAKAAEAARPKMEGDFPHTVYYFKTITRIKNAHETCNWPLDPKTVQKVNYEVEEFRKLINDLDYTVIVSADLHGAVERNGYCFNDEEEAKYRKMIPTVK